MKKILTALLLVLVAAAGCSGAADDIVIGDRPYHIDPSTCDPDSRRVIDQEQLSQINRCASERVAMVDGTPASYVVIRHGPGMDCPAGCIYEEKAAIVLPDRVAILPEPFLTDREIRDRLNHELYLALPGDVLRHAERHLVERDGQWQMVLTFDKYLEGTVTLNPDRRWEESMQVDAVPTGILTAPEAQERVLEAYAGQCQPPGGALLSTELTPLEEGGWLVTVVWEMGDVYHKVAARVDNAGAVTFPDGCGN
ncbi:hypothetical protein [Symbiobacterium terraclitae]|uniref:hypothetical protein n=1 Tax=Symbiobacterium terraclitae TaxID=557451 RepID=UPI0035B54DE3